MSRGDSSSEAGQLIGQTRDLYAPGLESRCFITATQLQLVCAASTHVEHGRRDQPPSVVAPDYQTQTLLASAAALYFVATFKSVIFLSANNIRVRPLPAKSSACPLGLYKACESLM